MKFRSYSYLFGEAMKSFFRNRLMSFASVLTVASCALIVIVSFCIASNVDYILEQIENTVGLSAFIEDDVASEEITLLYAKITEIPYVDSVLYISSEEAKQIYTDTFGEENRSLLEGLSDDTFPRSFKITVTHNMYQSYVLSELEKYIGNGFEVIRHESRLIEILMFVNRGIRIICIVVILSLALISVIIIMNTIKLAVNMRSLEIGIMKYVGATDSFIRLPFVIEGVFIGILGAAIPSVISFFSYERVILTVSEWPELEGIASFRTGEELFWFIIPVCIVAGALMGSFGSTLSISKYLKV